ncbi:AcrR family transcriptional regulator [Kibdelosporangium banguiense]|uniref:AcrR family transcriptional regulator n=1 Tax=Kibdelosporangium banguiense TaxID=1365924 RepID=A0ABS4TJG4_9PSEU|nr:TetR/AcrR family transcriptional regulator [Kibdelosporangium banguiense]MBP2324557.1 AcrR family transcriptional regulator [Kibdelosporangium banguiense]
MRRTAAETREHVLAVAHDLFYWHGIRAVGIDRLAAEAGAAPTTLYRIFTDKDDLVAAYIERAHALSEAWFSTAVKNAGPDPLAQIDAAFVALADQLDPAKFRGCACMMALAEFPDPNLPAHKLAIASKRWIHTQFTEMTSRIEDIDASVLADQLTLIWEGANTSAAALGTDGPARQARTLAATALTAATTTPKRHTIG